MVRAIRIAGVAFMVCGVFLVITYTISPLRFLWRWFQWMDLPLQIGTAVAGIGLVILLTTMLFERLALRSYDKELKES
jgi:ABC-type sulfate transport system permease component